MTANLSADQDNGSRDQGGTYRVVSKGDGGFEGKLRVGESFWDEGTNSAVQVVTIEGTIDGRAILPITRLVRVTDERLLLADDVEFFGGDPPTRRKTPKIIRIYVSRYVLDRGQGNCGLVGYDDGAGRTWTDSLNVMPAQ